MLNASADNWRLVDRAMGCLWTFLIPDFMPKTAVSLWSQLTGFLIYNRNINQIRTHSGVKLTDGKIFILLIGFEISY